MNKRIKQAMMARRRRSDGTFMTDYTEPYARSGSFGVNPDGTTYPIYPNMIKRDSRGRFTSRHQSGFPGVPPIYRGQPMNKIGFAVPNEITPYDGNEFESRYSETTPGHAESWSDQPMRQETALQWTKEMENADGTTGPHWGMEQARQIMDQYKIHCDEVEFFVTLNMMYSDYCKVAKKFNVSTTEFYACLAKAFLEDKDAGPGKLNRYYEYIVEK